MWQRWNQSTHIFEKSDNDGTTWVPLPLNGAIITEGGVSRAVLPGEIAYEDQPNTFSSNQTFNADLLMAGLIDIWGGSGTAYHTAAIEIRSTNGYPRIGFHWPGVVASQIGMDSAGWIRTWNNPGNDFENFAAKTIQGTNVVTTAGNVQCAGNYHSTAGYLYPGNYAAGGAYQTSWFLGSHSSYGLYTTTGLYIETYLWCHNIYSRGVIGAIGFKVRPGTAGVEGANSFNINWNGSVGMWIDASFLGNMTLTSDARIKRDFTPLVGSLEKIKRLLPGSFRFHKVTDSPADPDLHLGITAQDAISVIPELVHNTGMVTPLTPDGLLRVDYVEMIPLLIGAVQELARKIEGT